METCSFQSQLLSVMEVLAKAAVEEIHRRVDDSCAVLRLELSQSRRDIDLLKRRYGLMEAELRRSRMRARRKVSYPPAAERQFPVVLNKETQLSPAWSTQEDADTPNQPQQCKETDPANEAQVPQIKVECAAENVWKNEQEDKLISGAEPPPGFNTSQSVHADGFVDSYHSAENPVNQVLQTGGYDTFRDQQLNQNETELVVKQEEEPDENAAPVDSGNRFVTSESDGQLWMSSQQRDISEPSFSYSRQQYEQTPAVFGSQSGLEDVVPQIHSAGNSHCPLVSAARVKRRARTFGFKRLQPDEIHGTLSQINSTNQSSTPQTSQHQNSNSPHLRTPNEALFGLARRMRTSWRSGGGSEKRFSCTYCGKRFMRFSQLKEHLRSHTGEKPFSCQQCGKAFTKQCNLIRHAVVHSGEKPYECSLCGKCFTQRSSLKSHQKTAH